MNITGNNSTSTNYPAYYQEATSATIARLTFFTAIAFVGVVGNVFVCIVIISKKLRGPSSMHTYLLNLAIADIGVLAIIFPLGVLKERHPDYWPFGKFVCEYLFPVIDTFFGASIWCITAIALQRYQNIVKNKELHRPSRSTKTVICGVISIWVVSFLVLSLPLHFVYQYQEVRESVTLCVINWQETSFQWLEMVYILVRVVFSYLVPLAVISWTYLGIWQEIRKSILFHKHLEKESGSKNKECRRSGDNARARKILTPIVVTFALTMLPLQLFNLLFFFWPPMKTFYHFWTIHYIVVMVTIMNSAINPIIYSVVSKDFRNAFWQLTFKKAADKPGVQTATFLLSRSRSDRGMQDRHSSFNQSKQKPQQPASTNECPNETDNLQETIL